MANIGQSIVLGVEIDQSATGPTQNFKGSIKTVGMASDCEALLLEEIADCIVSTVLLVGKLGI